MDYVKTNKVKKQSYELQKGDVVLSGGQEFAFSHWKKGGQSFAAVKVTDPSVNYKIRANHSGEYEVIGKFEFAEKQTEIDLLKKSPKGTLFLIENKKSSELFRLDSFTSGGKIKAISPLTNCIFTIDPSYSVTLLSNLK